MPLQIYMSEANVSLEQLGKNVVEALREYGRCILVVSEGFDVGDLGASRDTFGHVQFSASQTTVAQVVTNYINSLDLPVPGKARFQVPGTDQRNAIAYASVVDLDEAYRVGCHAVAVARNDGNGYMATILRDRTRGGYSVTYDKVPLEQVAARDRSFPERWLSPDRIDVTDEFVEYARPLIGSDWVSVPQVDGLARFARISQALAPKKLPAYVPQTYRG
jgi:6-phosphofructokinase 1